MSFPHLFRDRKQGRTAGRLITLIVFFLALLGFTIWLIHSNTVPVLTEVSVPAKGLPETFDGFRIVQISDLHDAEFGSDHAGTLSLIREAAPDVIFFTGDLVDSHRTDVEQSVSLVRQALEIAPCYYVTGNHEGRIPDETYAELESALLTLGVTVLHGEGVALERNGATITLVGIDSPDFKRDSVAASTPLADLCENGYTILLAHHPEFSADYAEAGADLVFSGHAHGGQFRIPFVGGVVAPGQGFFPEYDSGLYTVPTEKGETLLYVSRGLGNSIIPIRFANRPEVILAVLETH